MHECGELLGWLHPCKQRDLSPMRKTLRGSNSLGETNLDALRFHELEQPFAVSAHVAIDFAQCWKFFAFGLTDVKNVDGPESVQRPLTLGCCILTRLVGRYIFVFRRPTIGARMKMPFSPRLTKRPSEFHVRSPATLVASGFCRAHEHDVAEAVGVKLRHCSEVCGEDFTVTRLQRCNEEIHGLFWFVC